MPLDAPDLPDISPLGVLGIARVVSVVCDPTVLGEDLRRRGSVRHRAVCQSPGFR
jgi:hypothetical protein